MFRTVYLIPQMDCPCEERLVRLKMDDEKSVRHLAFDLDARTLTVTHDGAPDGITSALESLRLGARLVSSEETGEASATAAACPATDDDRRQRRLLWTVLAVNAAFFLLESLYGYLSRSMGLFADSLDMLADAMVYGISLWAVGSSAGRKRRVAFWAGILQGALAFWGLSEAISRFLHPGEAPAPLAMIVVSLLALLGNACCLILLRRSQSKEAHIAASTIFSANDVLVNLGVIVSGILVLAFASPLPDLVVSILIFLLVLTGAWRILRLSR